MYRKKKGARIPYYTITYPHNKTVFFCLFTVVSRNNHVLFLGQNFDNLSKYVPHVHHTTVQ
jgi:hypothetical protein